MDIDKIILSLSEMTLLASRLRNNLNDGSPFTRLTEKQNEDAEAAIDRAWELFEDARVEQQIANAPEDNDEDAEPSDFETLQAERDRREYEDGKAQALQRQQERRIYGDALADTFHAQDDLNAYNRGEE